MKLSVLVTAIAVLGVSACTGDTQTDLSTRVASLAQMVAAGEDHVTVQELTDWLIKDRRDFELVDIRDIQEFDAGHIEGARHIPRGGYNYWHAYLNDPEKAGVAEMDAAQRAHYRAVACYFAGDYVAAAGLLPKGGETPPTSSSAPQQGDSTDALGLGLGLGSDQVRQLQLPSAAPGPAMEQADPLGLGLGLGSDEVKAATQPKKAEPGETRKLLIRAEC